MADKRLQGTEESWLTDGNCAKCRRNIYCSKDCKKHKQAMQALFRSMLEQKLGGDFLSQLEHYT